MKTEIVQVTPKLARSYLERNTRNRPLRPSHVERLRASFERGEYVMTHQGIAFSDDGSVADGQHRLAAVAQLPDHFSFPMLVTTGLNHELAFPVIDIVQATRSVSDVLGIDRKVVEVGLFMCRLYHGRGNGITPTLAAPFIGVTLETTAELLAFCGTTSKTWSATPVRSAAVFNMMTGIDRDYVKLIYHAMVAADFDVLPPVAKSLFRSQLSGKVRAVEAYDIFVRCLRAFNPAYSNLSKIQINDQSADIAAVRAWLDEAMARRKKIAPAKAEAKTKARSNSTLRVAA